MRFSYFVLVLIYVVADISCVFACIADIFSKLDQEQHEVCSVGQKSEKNCITCNCVKENTLVCTKTCDTVSLNDTTLCFRPKLKKHMTQKLTALHVVEDRYKKIANLAKGCKVGAKIKWEFCKCCNCVCAASGVARCKPIKGCKADKEQPVTEKMLRYDDADYTISEADDYNDDY